MTQETFQVAPPPVNALFFFVYNYQNIATSVQYICA